MSKRQRLQKERLHEEIEELRGDLGETVDALVHKADVPARAKERGSELTEQALERGSELTGQAVERGTEFASQVIDRGNELKGQLASRGSEVRDQAIDVAERARGVVSQTPKDRWAKWAGSGLALIVLIVIVWRVRNS